MGCFASKDKLSKEDMDFLKSHTRYDEATIKEWYKGFKVSITRDNGNILKYHTYVENYIKRKCLGKNIVVLYFRFHFTRKFITICLL